MTHRKDRYGRGRRVHFDSTIRLRRYFTLSVLAMVAVGIFPPLIIPLGIVAVVIARRERARIVAARPTYRDEMLARGREDI